MREPSLRRAQKPSARARGRGRGRVRETPQTCPGPPEGQRSPARGAAENGGRVRLPSTLIAHPQRCCSASQLPPSLSQVRRPGAYRRQEQQEQSRCLPGSDATAGDLRTPYNRLRGVRHPRAPQETKRIRPSRRERGEPFRLFPSRPIRQRHERPPRTPRRVTPEALTMPDAFRRRRGLGTSDQRLYALRPLLW